METQKNITVLITAKVFFGNDPLGMYQANQTIRLLSMQTGLNFPPPSQTTAHGVSTWKSEAEEIISISIPPHSQTQEQK